VSFVEALRFPYNFYIDFVKRHALFPDIQRVQAYREFLAGTRLCGEIAYGDVKRLELAIALANQPKLLLMDEPAAGMAPGERRQLMSLTEQIVRTNNIGVLFTEHDMDIVFGHADRVLVLNRGELIAEGSPEEIRARKDVRAIYLGAGILHGAPQ